MQPTCWVEDGHAGDVDEVEISTVPATQSPAHSDIHTTTDILGEAKT